MNLNLERLGDVAGAHTTLKMLKKPFDSVPSQMSIKLNLEPVSCCEICNETIYSYMDCPVCEKPVQVWGDPYELDEGETITCEECKNTYELTAKDEFVEDWLWKKV